MRIKSERFIPLAGVLFGDFGQKNRSTILSVLWHDVDRSTSREISSSTTDQLLEECLLVHLGILRRSQFILVHFTVATRYPVDIVGSEPADWLLTCER